MLNYLARRGSSLRYVKFTPLEFVLYGEDRILEAFEASPPDFVALAHLDTSEDGAQFFGRDYGLRLASWIRSHYRRERLIGAEPFQDERFGILLLRRAENRLDREGGD